MTVRRQEDDLGPPDMLLRAVAVGDHRRKLAAVSRAQSDVRSLVHSQDSHMRVIRGIHKRIEMSDFIH
jgi:hypothetical protein